jgi:hypothetical protein
LQGKLGDYSIQRYLGSISGEPTATPVISKGVPVKKASFYIALGVHRITSIREILDIDKKFQVDPDIKISLQQHTEYYRVSLVADFFHQEKNIKFSYATIRSQLVSSQNAINPQIYSISPQRVDEQVQISKEFGINPQLQLSDVTISGVTYTNRKEYVKMHPQIVGHFSAGQTVSWEFMTTNGIDDIIGAQLVEFMVRQPSNVRTRWEATPEADINWAGKVSKLGAILSGKSLPKIEDKFEQFSVPLY